MNGPSTQSSMATAPFLSGVVPPGQAGITILEILISLSLGLLLVAGIGTIFLGSNQTYRVQEDSARMQETGRFAIETIGRALRQAGYADIPVNPVSRKLAFTGTTINGINTSCPAASPTTDVITVQYDGIAGEQDCQANNVAADQIVQQTFFLGNGGLRCDAVLANAPPTPPASCPADNTGDELVQNVEDLQVLYGIDTNNNQSADQYTATPGNWGQVVSAKVCVLVRSENTATASTTQSYLNCQGALGAVTGAAAMTTATDTRLRRAFVATFNLRNRVTSLP
jgi:type IV pilus assembly protein PilW